MGGFDGEGISPVRGALGAPTHVALYPCSIVPLTLCDPTPVATGNRAAIATLLQAPGIEADRKL
jgi:hypothetical protein